MEQIKEQLTDIKSMNMDELTEFNHIARRKEIPCEADI